MVTQAKCPGCGDVEGIYLVCLSEPNGDYGCRKCGKVFPLRDGLMTLTDADIEAVARRVVELMREGG